MVKSADQVALEVGNSREEAEDFKTIRITRRRMKVTQKDLAIAPKKSSEPSFQSAPSVPT